MKTRKIPGAFAFFVVALILVPALPGCRRLREGGSAAFGPGDREGVFNWDGQERTYILHLPPAYDGKTPLPMVMVLHGGLGSGGDIIATDLMWDFFVSHPKP